ncbi:MAG: hypothetical protein JO042_14165 [Sinobacteraceae bacterium]|nr:hypothetical protein [Nevskiaceae bacterium]
MPRTKSAVVDHSTLIGACVNCHNGIAAAGKAPTHIASNNVCENCHTTNAWIPARFDHAAVLPHTCTTCHDSVHAMGKPRGHIATTQQCDSCHGTLAWMPVMFDHATVTGPCANCHNNAGAIGKPANHMTTPRDCVSCHISTDWNLITFKHVSASYPGQHRAVLSCVSCHTSNAEQVPYPAPAYAGTCAGCHFKNFNPAAHPKTLKGRLYSAGELANCSGACHVYSDSTQSIIRSLPGPYHRVSDATFKR